MQGPLGCPCPRLEDVCRQGRALLELGGQGIRLRLRGHLPCSNRRRGKKGLSQRGESEQAFWPSLELLTRSGYESRGITPVRRSQKRPSGSGSPPGLAAGSFACRCATERDQASGRSVTHRRAWCHGGQRDAGQCICIDARELLACRRAGKGDLPGAQGWCSHGSGSLPRRRAGKSRKGNRECRACRPSPGHGGCSCEQKVARAQLEETPNGRCE